MTEEILRIKSSKYHVNTERLKSNEIVNTYRCISLNSMKYAGYSALSPSSLSCGKPPAHHLLLLTSA